MDGPVGEGRLDGAAPPASADGAGSFSEPFAVPRRYGVGTMLIVTSAFAAVYGLLKSAGAGAGTMAFVTLLIGVTALAQMITRKWPRLVSMLAGAVVLPAWTAIQFAGRVPSVQQLILGCFGLALYGAVLGYVTGTLVSGLFLLVHLAARRLGREGR